MSDDLLDNLGVKGEVPPEANPMSLEELNALQARILACQRGEPGAVKPTREELKRAYDSLRMQRAGARSTSKPAAKVSSPPIDLDGLFGPSTE